MIQLLIELLILLSFLPFCHANYVNFYWLADTQECQKFHIYFDNIFNALGIIYNKNQRVNGDCIAYPALEPIMGPLGSASAVNESRERKKFRESLQYFELTLADINDDFSGLGVIRLRLEEKYFMNKSTKKYVKLLMTESLLDAKARWPKAHWGYENILYCPGGNGGEKIGCGPTIRNQSHRLSWLWEKQDIIVPRLTYDLEHSNADNLRYVAEELNETRNIIQRYNIDAEKVIPALSLTEMSLRLRSEHQPDDNYEVDVLRNIIDTGADKILLTGDYDFFMSETNCEKFSKYLQNVLESALNVTRKYKYSMLWPNSSLLSYAYSKSTMPRKNSQPACESLPVLFLGFCLYATHILLFGQFH